jgi:phosphohistidine phosphatase
MKKLYIVRHATAEDPAPKMSDYERPLSAKGISEADLMAHRLQESLFKPQKILASSALRTTMTAQTMSKILEQEDLVLIDELYNAPYETLLEYIETAVNALEELMIIAHNPGVSMLMSYFMGNYATVPPCTVIELHFDLNDWSAVDRKHVVFDEIRTTLD